MIETVSPAYSPADLDRLFKQQWVTRAFIKTEGFRVVRSTSPEFRTAHGKFVALLVGNVFSPADQRRRAKQWADIRGSLGNRASVFPKTARMLIPRKGGGLTSRIAVPEKIVKAAGGQTALLGFDHERKRKDGRWVGRMTPDTSRYPDLFVDACRDAARLTEIFYRLLPAEYAKQKAAYDRIYEDWRIANTVFTSIYGISMSTACHTDSNDSPEGTGIITAAGSWSGAEFIVPEFKLAFDMRPGDVLFVDVHRIHGNLQRISGHRVAQVHYIRTGMEECLGLDNKTIEEADGGNSVQ